MKKLITGIVFGIVLTVGIVIAIGAGATTQKDSKVKNIEYNTVAATKKEKLEIKNIITQSTDNFYLEPGTIAIEFKNGSYAYSNTDTTGNKTYCFDNGKEIIEFQDREEFKAYIGLDKVLEVVTQENKDNAGFLIEEGEKALIVLEDESYITLMENGEYRYYPVDSENDVFVSYESLTDLKDIINNYL